MSRILHNAPLITEIESAFGALVKALQAYQANPTASTLSNVSAALNSAAQNVSQFEVAVKNPNTSTEVAAFSTVIAQAVSEIAALIPAQSTTPTLNERAAHAKHLKAKDFKNQINSIFKGHKGWKPLK